MASKDYFDRIIATLQSDLTSQKTEISELKATVARQQQEIEALKTSNIKHKSQASQQIRLNTEALLKEVKRVCDEAILANYNHLPTMFADRQDFETFRKSAEQKFLSADLFNAYKRSQEIHLKSIEEKLNHRFSFFSINPRKYPQQQTHKALFSITTIIQFFKTHNPQWLIRILVCGLICMLAAYMINSIT